MIYPTRRLVALAGAGAIVALAVGAYSPAQWAMAMAWPLAMVLLFLVDAGSTLGKARALVELPASASVGERRDAKVSVAIESRLRPRRAEVAIAGSPVLALDDDGRANVALDGGRGAALLGMDMVRRGIANVSRSWLRWTGPLGLAWRQVEQPIDERFPILPDIRPVRDQGAAIIQRHALQGLIAQLERGDGTDFDALVEFRQGMDRRSIDWKQSARHLKLHAKQYRSERNNLIVFAVDSGRLMTEPVAGLPRVDRAVAAALLTAWVALKMGDRVAIHAFDSRPRLTSGLVSGAAAFGELQRVAAEIDYSSEETNYTYALTSLASGLNRRSMVILATEFSDDISADFLVRSVRQLTEKHLVIVLVLRDDELEAIADAAPTNADDLTRSITATSLLRQRRTVLTRLQHLGVHVIESEYDKVNERLVAGYLDLKRRNLL